MESVTKCCLAELGVKTTQEDPLGDGHYVTCHEFCCSECGNVDYDIIEISECCGVEVENGRCSECGEGC